MVLRDATQLTGSVTVSTVAARMRRCASHPRSSIARSSRYSVRSCGYPAARIEATSGSSAASIRTWIATTARACRLPGYDAITQRLAGVVSTDLNAPPNTPYYSNLSYSLKQHAFFGEGTWFFTPQWSATAGLRYYNFKEDRVLNFGGFFADPTPPGGVPGKVDLRRCLAARDPHLQSDRRHQSQCAVLSRLPARRHQRSHQHPAVLTGGHHDVRRAGQLARRESEELRGRRQDVAGRAACHVERLGVLQ